MLKREDLIRQFALDQAIRCINGGGEDISFTTARAAAFLSFLRGTNAPRPKKARKRS